MTRRLASLILVALGAATALRCTEAGVSEKSGDAGAQDAAAGSDVAGNDAAGGTPDAPAWDARLTRDAGRGQGGDAAATGDAGPRTGSDGPCAPEGCPGVTGSTDFLGHTEFLPGCCVDAKMCGVLLTNPDPSEYLGYPEGCFEMVDDFVSDDSCPSPYVCSTPGNGNWHEWTLSTGCRRSDGSCGTIFNRQWAWAGCISGYTLPPVPAGLCINYYWENCRGTGCPSGLPP